MYVMIESPSCNVSFGAKFVRNAKIKKLNPLSKGYEKMQVSFVRIDPKNLSDINALGRVADTWVNEKFASTIYNRALSLRKGGIDLNSKIFAITSQKDNFKKLDADRILGVAEIEELTPKSCYLGHIQVDPNHIYYEVPPFKGVGTAILNRLKDMYSQISLNSAPECSVRHFYEMNGFQRVSEDSLKYYWQKDKFFMI